MSKSYWIILTLLRHGRSDANILANTIKPMEFTIIEAQVILGNGFMIE